jgi:replicative DNA helicase
MTQMGGVRSAASILEDAGATCAGRLPARLTPYATGFDPLDAVLGGGVRTEDLLLVGGRPGVGKTIAMLQWARRVAMSGHDAVYACYEHGEDTLLTRLLCLELGELARPEDVPALDKLRMLAREVALGARGIGDLLEASPLGAAAYDVFRGYADRLRLLRATGATDAAELGAIASEHAPAGGVLFVDYLQKIPALGPPMPEAERVTQVAGALKELALACDVAVVACVAADRDGLVARRLRIHHLRGSTALAHEADVVVTLNEKWSAVSKTHLAYDATRARTYRQWAVASIEKNRDGPAGIDVEFRKDFANYRFDPMGRFVAEQLVDDVLFEE